MRVLLFLLAGCPFIGNKGYEANVRDVDEDGVEAVRFGGDDCDDGNPNVTDCDEDNDGFISAAQGGDDCDDQAPQINPEALEACDGVDNDCDGLIDGRDEVADAQLLPFYPDADGDGFGDANATAQLSCDPIPGFVFDQNLDCDDARDDVNPGAVELCDDIDHNCDGDLRLNASNPTAWFADDDGDGAAGIELPASCDAPSAEALTLAALHDCDDQDATRFPGNPEIFYNGVDNDCLGGSDDDADLDGYDLGVDDCDDANALVNPDATEFCDLLDNDCNGMVDDGVQTFQYWVDTDQDGAGNAVLPPLDSCQHVSAFPGYVTNDRDCDDADADRNLDAPEICDGKDNDCDSIVDDDDEDLDTTSWIPWYADVDADGYGRDEDPVLSCAPPVGYVAEGGDCDDELDFVNPDPFTPERCDTFDNDCDGEIDEQAVDAVIFFFDADMDGYGNPDVPVPACNDTALDISATDDDCNDTDPDVHPGAEEICGDNIRQDCLPIDPGDCDGDGVIGVDAGGTDCDDTDPTVSPLAPEICDGKDNDCDQAVDDTDPDVDLTTARNWYEDLDGDGSGAGSGVFSCQPPLGRVSHDGDCDDHDPDVLVGGIEICDSKDNDCNTVIDDDPTDPSTWYADADFDTYGDSSAATYEACAPSNGTDVANGDDCNDTIATINPAATEVCDGFDNNCSGQADDNAVDALQFYLDNDLDTFGAPSLPVLACGPSAGVVANSNDCNDTDPATHPGATEICYDNQRQDCLPLHLDDCDSDGFVAEDRGGDDCDDASASVNIDANEVCDGLDNDCNELTDSDDPAVDLTTTTDWYLDGDEDGFGAGAGVSSCGQPPGRVLSNTDCLDSDAHSFPGADERCDGVDNDCEGGIDEAPVVGAPAYYLDGDGDGFGAGPADTSSCDAPSPHHVLVNGDCDDDRASTFPGTDEVCDSIDNDCNGAVDDSPINGSTYWADADGDGFGAASQSVQACSSGGVLVTNPDDCNDAAAEVNPGAEEICYDTVRQDCSAADLNDCDADGAISDDFGGTDCEDEDDTVYPGQPEICDGLDNDCNGLLDEDDPDVDLTTTTTWYLDDDDDGFGGDQTTEACGQPAHHTLVTGDCDDGEPLAYPGAVEVCDGVDNDCDGGEDDADPEGPANPLTYYRDTDTDGFGDDLNTAQLCDPIDSTYVLTGGDCNDNVAVIFPGADEVCDGGLDNDCDGTSDDNDPSVQGQSTWYADNDGDGYPVSTSTLAACNQPPGYAPLAADDCNDNAATVNPGAQEVCNAGIDDDCNGLADLNDPGIADATEWFRDVDGDQYGAGHAVIACNQPPGHSGNDLDCDDQSNAVNPGTAEICDLIDNDCDGLSDDDDPGVQGVTTWYLDDDGDTFGSLATVPGMSPIQACAQPGSDYVLNNSDCLDNQSDVNPNAVEICDGIDNDCNLLTDANDPGLAGANTWYPDHDEDSFGANDVEGLVQCTQPVGFVVSSSDCNDADAGIRPGATEICNGGIDDDCDGDPDDEDSSVVGTQPFVADQDGDQYANYASTISACNAPAGFITDPGTPPDCNDNNTAVNPGAQEVCDTFDNDCDGHVDANDSSVIADTFYRDQDVDGYGTNSDTQIACTPDPGYIAVSGDCDDGNDQRNPAADEICDSLDNDCDNQTDDADPDVINVPTWYDDDDHDGFGLEPGTTQCTQPAGTIATGGDCVDNNSDIRPNQVETCNDIDDDCDGDIDDDDSLVVGGSTFVADADGDGYANYSTTTISCDQPSGFISNPGTDPDCNDNNVEVNPGAQEICNQGLDDDCDGHADADDDDVTATEWFADDDGDGFGDIDDSTLDCQQPTGFVANDADCNDLNPGVFPGSIEACDGVDNDCDGDVDDDDSSVIGQSTYYPDADGDNFGADHVAGVARCVPLAGEVANNTDCNDGAAGVSPASLEICNGNVDDNCNGLADDNDGTVFGQQTWFDDDDGDGFGDENAVGQTQCIAPTGEVTNSTDCDDSESAVNPASLEVCNGGVDDNCDGLADDDAGSGAFGQATYYADVDGDGFGDEDDGGETRCDAGADEVTNDFDCNDAVGSINPGALEICNGADDDCDGDTDDDDSNAFGKSLWIPDNDLDHWGAIDGTPIEACDNPTTNGAPAPAYVTISFVGDCNDDEPLMSPALTETYYDGLDNDCNTFTVDNDQDGDGSPSNMLTGGSPDCDDDDDDIKPGASEIYYDPGSVDEDCDPGTNSNDQDGDGWTSDMADGGAPDCHDTDPTAFPHNTAPRTYYDNIDDDCSGSSDFDQDGDGDNATVDYHIDGPHSTDNPVDCDDLDPFVTAPTTSLTAMTAEELQERMDNNCDATIILTGTEDYAGQDFRSHGRSFVIDGNTSGYRQFRGGGGGLFDLTVDNPGDPRFANGWRPTFEVRDVRVEQADSFFVGDSSFSGDAIHANVVLDHISMPNFSGFVLRSAFNVSVVDLDMSSSGFPTTDPLFDLIGVGSTPARTVTIRDFDARGQSGRLFRARGLGSVFVSDVLTTSSNRTFDIDLLDTGRFFAESIYMGEDSMDVVQRPFEFRGGVTAMLTDVRVNAGGSEAVLLLKEGAPEVVLSHSVLYGDSMDVVLVEDGMGDLTLRNSLIVGGESNARLISSNSPAPLKFENTVLDTQGGNILIESSTAPLFCQSAYIGGELSQPFSGGTWDPWDPSMPECSGVFGLCNNLETTMLTDFTSYDISHAPQTWDLTPATGGALDGTGATPCNLPTVIGNLNSDLGPHL